MHTFLLERCTFPETGTPVACAVSGGPDSLALLVLAVEAGCDVTAVHVDHGLRSGSETEAKLVEDAAGRFGAKFVSLSVSLDGGKNLEASARSARFEALPDGAVTGHTADDQAETVLINMMRGAGIDGLGGMSTERHPILQLRRSETHALCDGLKLNTVLDPSNDDLSILRNRVRHELIPLLNAMASRDIVPVLARQAGVLRDEAQILDMFASEIDVTEASAVAAAKPPLARRALRNWLRPFLDEESHPPDLAAIERVLQVARNESRAADVFGGTRVVRTHQRLRIVQTKQNE